MDDVVWLFYRARSFAAFSKCLSGHALSYCLRCRLVLVHKISSKRGHKEQFRISCPLSPLTLQSSCFPLSYPRTMPASSHDVVSIQQRLIESYYPDVN
eukprot:scaffold20620_cov78-Skeletonema_dohrnii-CCMP3373.AAC.2